MLIAIQLEERDMAHVHGDPYRQYQREVSMLIPVPKKR
jgi:protein-S-isoprenylcysteine O-methyltransferase Ste14